MSSSYLHLFGPQEASLPVETISEISRRLSSDNDLAPLARIVSALPHHWEQAQSQHPHLIAQSTSKQLKALSRLPLGETYPIGELFGCVYENCLTIILHAICLLDLDKKLNNSILDRQGETAESSFQGFCVGLLSAVAAATASSRSHYFERILQALLFAVFIGVVVDKDEEDQSELGHQSESFSLRWKSSSSKTGIESLIENSRTGYVSCVTDTSTVTVTVQTKDSTSLLAHLNQAGCLTRPIDLRGRFHSDSNRLALQTLLEGIDQRQSSIRPLDFINCHPVRSNSTSVPLPHSSPHLVFQDILTLQADWKETVIKSTENFTSGSPKIFVFGTRNVVPRLALKAASKSFDVTNVELCTISTTREQDNLSTSGAKMEITQDKKPQTAASDVPVSLAKNKSHPYEKIAVIGMAGRFAKSDTLAELWDLLQSGQNAVSAVPTHRFDMSKLQRQPHRDFHGNFLQDPDAFDHQFFGISPREAKSMDPQQRILLEVAYDTLAFAGYFSRSESQAQSNIGCYVGVGSVDYDANIASHDAGAFSATGTLRAFISGKVSHHFGWSGPSTANVVSVGRHKFRRRITDSHLAVTYDTACSSSAVALHSACMALQTGECSEALAGGVNVITNPALYQNLAAASFLSPSGASKAFDAAADGYCRGEGAGLVLLKPYARALADGDEIYGVITGSAVNQGSNCSPITVPHSDSQRDLYQMAMHRGGVSAETVSYVECHGTGTPVGDPIEYESVRKTLVTRARREPVHIGSIKDAIGHCEGASGIAGLLKVLLMFQHRILPKQANFTARNPNLSSVDSHLVNILKETRPWTETPLVALVNNYGAGGNNAALVLEATPIQASTPQQADKLDSEMTVGQPTKCPVVVTGKTAEAVVSYCQALYKALSTTPSLRQGMAASTLAAMITRRQNPTHEFIWSDTASSIAELYTLTASVSTGNVVKKTRSPSQQTILYFSGQNGRKVTIDQAFIQANPLFERFMLECDAIIKGLGEPSLFPAIFASTDYEDVVELHCALFAVQYSSAMSWITSGLHVDNLIGHSFGQLTAMCVSGCLPIRDILLWIITRARLLKEHLSEDPGCMLALECSAQEAEKLINTADVQGRVDVACYNSPQHLVLAGSASAIALVEAAAKSGTGAAIKSTRLKNSHAYHSHLIDAIKPELLRVSQTFEFSAPRIPVETCTKGQKWAHIDAERLVEHSREAVFFSDAVMRLAGQKEKCVWIDAGAASPMSLMIQRVLGETNSARHLMLSVDLELKHEAKSVANTVCALWKCSIAARDWSQEVSNTEAEICRRQRLATRLPSYPFQKTTAWLDFVAPTPVKSAQVMSPPLSKPTSLLIARAPTSSGAVSYSLNTSNETFQLYTKGHAVLEQSLCPASMYLEMIAEGVSRHSGSIPRALRVTDLKISSPIGLSLEQSVILELTPLSVPGPTWSFTLTKGESQAPSSETHASGQLQSLQGAEVPAIERELNMLARLVSWERAFSLLSSDSSQTMNGIFVYKIFKEVVQYAPYYQGVTKFGANDVEAAGYIMLPAATVNDSRQNLTSPVALDNFLQVAGIHINCSRPRRKGEVFVCTEITSIDMDENYLREVDATREWLVYTSLDERSAKDVSYDILVFATETKKLTCVMKGVHFFSVNMKAIGSALTKINGPNVAETAKVDLHLPAPTLKNNIQQAPPHGTINPPANLPEVLSTSQPDISKVFRDLTVVLKDVIDVEESEVQLGSNLIDMGIDSLVLIELLSEIKKKFGTIISIADFADLDTAEQLCRVIVGSDLVSAVGGMPTLIRASSGSSDDSYLGSSGCSESGDPAHSLSTGATTPDDVSTKPQYDPMSAMHAKHIDTNIARRAIKVFSDVGNEVDTTLSMTGFANFYDEVYPQQSHLVVLYVVQAFARLGCPIASLRPGELLPPIRHAPQHQKVIRQLHRVLSDAGLIIFDESSMTYHRAKKDLPTGSIGTLHEKILTNFPQHRSEHKLLHTTAHRLAECLDGQENPTGLIFGDASARATLSDVYANAPMFKAGTILLTKYLMGVCEAIDPSKQIHILELGAGTGGTTSLLLEALSTTGKNFTYTFTDLSSSLVAAAKKKFRQYDFMRYSTMNIEVEPTSEHLEKYHVIISTNCIHATSNLVTSTTNIRKMLAADGILCLVELTRNLFWFDLVFGLLEGWWLFNDGREHVLADQSLWQRNLTTAGFNWVAWSQGSSVESNVCRLITASKQADTTRAVSKAKAGSMDSFSYKTVDGLSLQADVHYPTQHSTDQQPRPVVLMIHGGGHVLLSRKSFGAEQIRHFVDKGFIAVSVDYRLCPETPLRLGAMLDVRDALQWIRTDLQHCLSSRPDISIDHNRVVAAGWSTGGHLAMTLAWTTVEAGLQPPAAILSLYCPTDYSDSFWRRPNVPVGSEHASQSLEYNLLDGTFDGPVASYDIPKHKSIQDGWMALADARSAIPLHMNWHGQTLHVLLHGMQAIRAQSRENDVSTLEIADSEIQAISPLAHIRQGTYRTPTYLIHGTTDDLIPWQQTQRSFDALIEAGVDAQVDIVEGAPHLFDVFHARRNKHYGKIVKAGVDFLRRFV